jgi:hypothetical protein
MQYEYLAHSPIYLRRMDWSRPLPVSQQWQLPGWPAQIVSRLRAGVELAEHFVHGVDDRLRFIQLNLVT